MENLDPTLVQLLRGLAREGRSPSSMYQTLGERLGGVPHVLTTLHYFRHAFCLSLSEAKPFAALSRNETRQITDEAFLDELVAPVILARRAEWDVPVIERGSGAPVGAEAKS